MTESDEKRLIEEYEASDEGAQGLAAADLAAQIVNVLRGALDASGMDQKDLASKIGVSEGRVSQVLNSDGNLRIAALARYLRALGYEATLTARPVKEGRPELDSPRRSRRGVEPSAGEIAGVCGPSMHATFSMVPHFARMGDILRVAGAEIDLPISWPGHESRINVMAGVPGEITHEVKGPSGFVDLDAEIADLVS